MTDFVERPCVECGEPTYNERLCRDCDIEDFMCSITCDKCGRAQWRTDIAPNSHTPECPNGKDCEACGGHEKHSGQCPKRATWWYGP
jgi:hypothetical protein